MKHRPDVLLVEDSSFFRDVICSYLRPLNLRIATAEHGSEAIDLLHHIPVPQLIICDIEMPDMDGIELTQRLRMLPPSYRPYILILTASAAGDTVQRAQRAGADGYLLKLPPREAFLKKVMHILATHPKPAD